MTFNKSATFSSDATAHSYHSAAPTTTPESLTSAPVSFAQRMKRVFSPAERKRVQQETERACAMELLANCASLETDALLARLRTDRQGLTSDIAKELLAQLGPNKIHASKPLTWYQILFKAITHPFQILLLVLALSQVVMPGEQDWGPFSYLLFMFCFASSIQFFQEMKSTSAAQTLLSLYTTQVEVYRRANKGTPSVPCKIDRVDVVPGDIVQLTAGSLFPGDCIIISANDLMVGESSLTGESVPVQKVAGPVSNANGIMECVNIGLTGTNVQSGVGVAVIVNTGDKTFISGVAAELATKNIPTAYDRGVRQVSYLLTAIMSTLVIAIVLIIIYWGNQPANAAITFGIATACGVIPGMLPVVINANLLKGAMELIKHKAIVKQIQSIQNVGSMQVLCSDKTGTLTQDEIALIHAVDGDGNDSSPVLSWGFINAVFQEGFKNVMDHAIIEAASGEFGGFGAVSPVSDKFVCVAEIPFDFDRRCVSVVVQKSGGSENSYETAVPGFGDSSKEAILVAKGAVEEILAKSSHFADCNGNVHVLTSEKADYVAAIVADMNDDGLRVLGVATRSFSDANSSFSTRDEVDMVFQGCLSFLDPPKDTSIEAIQELAALAVEVKVLTGDNLKVSVKICRDVGIPVEHVFSGAELDSMDQDAFDEAVEVGTVFAKLSPSMKRRIVESLQSNGKVVGFLGDGINDALALKCADVGISVDTATEVAKDAADIILLEKSLLILSHAVRTGRVVYGNTIKYMKMAISSNFGNCFSNVCAAIWFPHFQPISAMMILTNTMLYDISQTSLPFDNMDESFVAVPRKWDISDLFKFVMFIGPTSSIFDLSTFAINLYYWGWNNESDESLALFQTSWFIMSLWTQTFVVHLLRTERIPFLQSTASRPVLIATFATCVFGCVLPFTPIGTAFGMTQIPGIQYGFFFMNIGLYVCVVMAAKWVYIRVNGRWL
ncbi:hypothetical protein HDU98_012257 [Podochytrium sp. JEL0797]|nr:hypothetical protein HDU98_012257 [Podochytrium sp. JEL0797]